MNINKVLVFGNLTRDPELRESQSGIAVCSIGVATNRIYNNKEGEKVTEVEYHNVVLFGKQAELVNQYLRKGSSIYVEGRLKTSSWEADGVKKYKTDIVAESFQFGPKKASDGGSQQQSTNNSSKDVEYPSDTNGIDPNDIPF